MAQVFLSYARRACPPCSHSYRISGHMASPSGVTRTVSMAASIGPKPLAKRLQPTMCCCSSGRRRPRPRTSLSSNGTRRWPCKKTSCHAYWIKRHSLQRSGPSTALMRACRTEALPKILHALQQPVTPPRAERQGYHNSSGDHHHRPCRSRPDRQGHVYAARLARARQHLSGRERHSRYACTPACQELVRKMADVGSLPSGTAQPRHRSTRFADQDTGDLHEPVSDDGSAANCIWDDRG